MATKAVKKAEVVDERLAHLPADYPDELKALIPDAETVEYYIDREIGGVPALDIFEGAFENGWHVITKGDTGAGKTLAKRAWCAQHGYAYVNVPCNGAIDPDTMWGAPETLEGGKLGFKPSTLVLAIKHGFALIDFDESNQAPQNVLAVVNALLDDRASITINGVIGVGTLTVPVGDNLLITTSYNPGYLGSEDLNEAFKNRFAVVIKWDYLREIEEQLVGYIHDDEWVVCNALLDVAGQLRAARAAGDIDTPISTNRLQAFVGITEQFGLDFAVENFVNQFDDEETTIVRGFIDHEMDRIRADFGFERVDEDDEGDTDDSNDDGEV